MLFLRKPGGRQHQIDIFSPVCYIFGNILEEITVDVIALRQKIPTTYFDYQRLKTAITGQSNPRRLIGRLISQGFIIKIKKGLYVWGRGLNPEGYSPLVLANLIYGPSYISLESALAFYNLIPERVETLTSVTFKKNKSFSTPAGHFEYKHIHEDVYPAGVVLVGIHKQDSALIATPEKALLDTIALRVKRVAPQASLSDLLDADLRIDPTSFAQLKKERLYEYASLYRSGAVKQFINKLQRNNG